VLYSVGAYEQTLLEYSPPGNGAEAWKRVGPADFKVGEVAGSRDALWITDAKDSFPYKYDEKS
jgi:hypothetical protein